MNTQITFFVAASGKIDRRRGVIKGVAVITVGEAKGHGMRVDATTLEQVRDCADQYVGGVAVRFAQEDHGGGAANIVGNLRNWQIDGDVLRADLYLLKAHQDYELVMEMAATMPESFGLSIVFSGLHEDTDSGVFARCTELYGVDIVKNPAANPSGLFQARAVDTGNDGEPIMATTKKEDQLKELEVQFAQTTAALKDAEAKLKADEEQFAVIVTEMSKLTTRVSELETQLATEQETGKQTTDALQAAATEINDLKTKLAEAEKSAGEKAQAQLAAIGVAPVAEETPAKPESKTLADHISELQKISDERARAEYFSANIAPKLKH